MPKIFKYQMNHPVFFDSKNSLKLFSLEENFKFISQLYLKKNLPKVLMFTGSKGSGKSTLINHFLYSIFDIDNYDKKTFSILKNSIILKQFQKNMFSNIIYINGADYKSVKIEDIRNLKKQILQSTISKKDRFIIFDDIELFNQNSLNALLKIIEEPSQKNYFFLINNKEKPLIETIKSRALEVKIILREKQRLEIINKLVNLHKLDLILDKHFLIDQIKELEGRTVNNQYINFTIAKNNNKINIFFDKETLNLIGWQTEDIYQNLVITYIYKIQYNQKIDKNIFKLPQMN